MSSNNDHISSIYVPNIGPEDADIILLGEAPGETEEKGNEKNGYKPEPFISPAGDLLSQVLSRNGILRESCHIRNLSNYRPHQNKFEHLVGSQQLKDGLTSLFNYLDLRVKAGHPPKLIVPLGSRPLQYLLNDHSKNITDYRGSILSGPHGIKVIPTFHPSYILRSRSDLPIFDNDIKRIYQDSKFPELRIPEREKITVKSTSDYEAWTSEILKHDLISVDIETFGTDLACIGFSFDSRLGVCFVANKSSDMFRTCVERILGDKRIRKIFQFGTFDINYLHDRGFVTENFHFDTMVAQHVMWPELPRGLAYLTSVYTRQPYYKPKAGADKDSKIWALKKFSTLQELWDYNCIDACVTLEIALEQMKEFEQGPEAWREFMEFEMAEHGSAFLMSRTGLTIDHERRKLFLASTNKKIRELESLLNTLAMYSINSGSPKQVMDLLYNKLGLPKQYTKDHKSPTGQRLTSNEDACVKLLSLATDDFNKFKSDDKKFHARRCIFIITNILEQRGLDKLRSSYLDISFSEDGRARSLFKVPGPETGRWSAESYLDDTGLNAQTFPRGDVEVESDAT